MSVFILENVSKCFVTNKVRNDVLKEINLSLPDKGLFSIVGKSGCGKSTLLNILIGIEKPSSGKVFFKGKNIAKYNDKKFSEYHLTGVSLVFQHYNLFNDLTAFENVLLPLEISGKSNKENKQKIKDLFTKFKIEKLLDRKVKNLSGGEKQRVAILRSLITDPKAILCDEPTGALDSQNSREIMGILREISKNKLVVMVSHNKELVNEFSDYILKLQDGRIEENKAILPIRNFNNFNEEKIKYSSRWTRKFLKLNLKKNFKKNLFSIIACILSFSAMLISVGFSEGSKSSQERALKQNLGLGVATASESQFIDIEGSPLSFEKTVRPSLELVDNYLSDFKSIRYEENLSYFISNYPSCYFNDSKINNFEMIPLYDATLKSYGSDMIVKGVPGNNEFEQIIVNEEFEKLLGGDCLNKTIVISNNSTINYQTGDVELPFVKDSLNFSKKFKICGVVREFSFLNTPKIYFSYFGAKNFLQNEQMENTSSYLSKRFTYYDYLEKCAEDDLACSYSCYLFVTDINEIDQFFNKVELMADEPLQITSKALETKNTYATFINSFSSTLIIFVIIAFIGINFILGMISLSTFLENRKNTAILTCLGSRNSSIYSMHIKENYLIVILSFILSIFFAKFLESKLNPFIYSKYTLENLIKIPLNSFLGIPFGLLIFLLLIVLICSTLFTLIPMRIYRQNSITDELRDE